MRSTVHSIRSSHSAHNTGIVPPWMVGRRSGNTGIVPPSVNPNAPAYNTGIVPPAILAKIGQAGDSFQTSGNTGIVPPVHPNGNTGIVPPSVNPNGNTGIVPPLHPNGNTGIVPPGILQKIGQGTGAVAWN